MTKFNDIVDEIRDFIGRELVLRDYSYYNGICNLDIDDIMKLKGMIDTAIIMYKNED